MILVMDPLNLNVLVRKNNTRRCLCFIHMIDVTFCVTFCQSAVACCCCESDLYKVKWSV